MKNSLEWIHQIFIFIQFFYILFLNAIFRSNGTMSDPCKGTVAFKSPKVTAPFPPYEENEYPLVQMPQGVSHAPRPDADV